ncbi:unnamed protein product [Parajaminaea phylloscopi]
MVAGSASPASSHSPPRAAKRRRRQRKRSHSDCDEDGNGSSASGAGTAPMPPRSAYPGIHQCSSIEDYERLNHIEEGTYGVVFRARHKPTGDIVALKKLKMDRERNGFPITSLREIRTLMMAKHENVVHVREVAVGSTLTQIFIVFEFVEHDLKTLLRTLEAPFLLSEIKSLMQQLLRAVALMHSQWIIHRDLKTSNLLLNNRGVLKVADFGLARLYGDSPLAAIPGHPHGQMTDLVVTLWYRAPELLLGAKRYDVAIDMWSVGCILAELVLQEPLFSGRNESDQMAQICRKRGFPSARQWPDFTEMPLYRKICRPLAPGKGSRDDDAAQLASLRSRFPQAVATDAFLDLLCGLLCYNPATRLTAEEALSHPWFLQERPAPAHPDSFSSFPSLAAGEMKHKYAAQVPEERPARRALGPGTTDEDSSSRSRPKAPTQSKSAYQMEWDF